MPKNGHGSSNSSGAPSEIELAIMANQVTIMRVLAMNSAGPLRSALEVIIKNRMDRWGVEPDPDLTELLSEHAPRAATAR
jgi:hypothetical protein